MMCSTEVTSKPLVCLVKVKAFTQKDTFFSQKWKKKKKVFLLLFLSINNLSHFLILFLVRFKITAQMQNSIQCRAEEKQVIFFAKQLVPS